MFTERSSSREKILILITRVLIKRIRIILIIYDDLKKIYNYFKLRLIRSVAKFLETSN